MKRLLSLPILLLLAACASAPPVQPMLQTSLYNDALFAPPSKPLDVENLFTVSPEMQTFLDTEIKRRAFAEGSVMALVDTLYAKGKNKFSYDATTTKNAAGVFAAHSGNCLSYTIMTAAFAKKMDLPVQFHVVTYGDVWDRGSNIDFRIGHVNLTVGSRMDHTQEMAQLIDFAAAQDAHGQYLDDIGEDVIIAMYLNNRAAEAMTSNNLDDAYWFAREAAKRAPSYLAGYNTLGVIYMRHNNMVDAERVFSRVLDREPENLLAMSNKVMALKALGRDTEATALAAQLAQIQPYPPFYYFNRGVRAMEQHDYVTAKADFTKEVSRASYNHQFHFWLALADYNLGDMTETQHQLLVAMENSPNDQQQGIYAAKLAYLKQQIAKKTN